LQARNSTENTRDNDAERIGSARTFLDYWMDRPDLRNLVVPANERRDGENT
jgi:hypothetical protein